MLTQMRSATLRRRNADFDGTQEKRPGDVSGPAFEFALETNKGEVVSALSTEGAHPWFPSEGIQATPTAGLLEQKQKSPTVVGGAI